MSLIESYRAKQAGQQNRWLIGYLGLALLLHGLGGFLLWQAPRLSQQNQSDPPTPIDFVYLDSISTQPQPDATTERRAQTQSKASRQSTSTAVVGAARRSNSAMPPSASGPTNPQTNLQTAPQTGLQTNPASDAPSRPPDAPPIRPAVRPADRSRAAVAPPSDFSQPIDRSPQTFNAPPRPAPQSSVIPASPSPSPSVARSIVGSIDTPERPAPNAGVSAQPTSPSRSTVNPPTGSGLQGSSNTDRPDTGTAVDAAEDPIWGSYLAGLNRLIDQNWQRVAVASTRRTEIRFRVDRQGRVTGLQLLRSSGDPAVDRAALEAVRAAAPFAPLPQTAPEEVLIVNFTFTRGLNPASP